MIRLVCCCTARAAVAAAAAVRGVRSNYVQRPAVKSNTLSRFWFVAVIVIGQGHDFLRTHLRYDIASTRTHPLPSPAPHRLPGAIKYLI